MAIKKPGLGKRNLDVLLSTSSVRNIDLKPTAELDQENKIQKLPVDRLQRGQYQPRVHMAQDALEELASSIKKQGIIQPIIVRPLSAKNQYEIIAGERRWRAAQLAGLHEVPVIVRHIPDEAALAMALIENIQRENLNPIEEAIALQRLMDEFSLTHQEMAEAVGKSRTGVTNLLRLLTLHEEVKRLLAENKLEVGHAKVLLALQGSTQAQIAKLVVMKGLTVRETESLVKTALSGQTAKPAATARSPLIRGLENNLSERLGTAVKLQHQHSGKGKLLIHYNTFDELEGILTHFNMADLMLD